MGHGPAPCPNNARTGQEFTPRTSRGSQTGVAALASRIWRAEQMLRCASVPSSTNLDSWVAAPSHPRGASARCLQRAAQRARSSVIITSRAMTAPFKRGGIWRAHPDRRCSDALVGKSHFYLLPQTHPHPLCRCSVPSRLCWYKLHRCVTGSSCRDVAFEHARETRGGLCHQLLLCLGMSHRVGLLRQLVWR